MKKLLIAFSFFTTMTVLTTLPALAAGNPTFKEMAKEYRHSFKSEFHDVHKSGCVEAYANGDSSETSFEFIKKGFTLTATQLSDGDAKYTFTPNFWRTGYVAESERNGTKFRLHARETVSGNFIIKMTTMELGFAERAIGYITCTVDK